MGVAEAGTLKVRNKPLISAIIVSWNVREKLRACLASLVAARHPAYDLRVTVVDNASSDGSAEMVSIEFPEFDLIVNEQNVGFVRANNQARRRHAADYYLLLNPDAELGEDTLVELVAALEDDATLAAVGPRLLNSDGSEQSSRRAFPRPVTMVLESTVLQRWFGRSHLLRDFYRETAPASVPQEVDWLVGACLLVRSSALAAGSLFDERYFMYSEEVDLCRRLKQAGWRVRYLPQVSVVHHEGASSEQALLRRHFYFHDSRCRYAARHFGATAGRRVRRWVILNYGYLWLEEAAKFVLGHRRELRSQRMATYARVLRAHLAVLRGAEEVEL